MLFCLCSRSLVCCCLTYNFGINYWLRFFSFCHEAKSSKDIYELDRKFDAAFCREGKSSSAAEPEGQWREKFFSVKAKMLLPVKKRALDIGNNTTACASNFLERFLHRKFSAFVRLIWLFIFFPPKHPENQFINLYQWHRKREGNDREEKSVELS